MGLLEPGQVVAALPIRGAYAEYVCLPQRELVPVPTGLDAAEAVSLLLNYVTAYQMLHRSAKVRPGQRVLIHGASGGVGTALLQLGRLDGLEMYGTCSSRGAPAVSGLGGIPIDYRDQDFVKEIHRLTGLPGRKRVVPYSIQWLKRMRPAVFRQDLIALFDLLQQQKIKPLIAQRFPLAEARHAHELLEKGGVIGEFVLVLDGSSPGAGAA